MSPSSPTPRSAPAPTVPYAHYWQLESGSDPIPTGLRIEAQQRCWVVKGNSWNFSMVDLQCRLWCLEGFELMIHIDQQFAHDCDECDFRRFVFGAQTQVERLQHGITSGRRQGCHVQGQADLGTTAADTTHPFHGTALPRPRSQAGQGGYFLAVEPAQFGHMRQDQP